MSIKHFINLRQRMLAIGMNQDDLAAATGKGGNYISTRMNAVRPCDANDMDCIGRALSISRNDYPQYFWEEPQS